MLNEVCKVLLKNEPDELEAFFNSNEKLKYAYQIMEKYDIKVELYRNDTLLDEKIIRFGFRKIEARADGFYLNYQKIKIRGLNRHQSYPYVRYAMPKSIQEEDALILKK